MDKIKVFSVRGEVIVHLVFWIFAFLYSIVKVNVSDVFNIKFERPVLFQITFYVVFVTTFYLQYFVALGKSFVWIKFITGTIVSLLFFIGFRAFLEQFLALKYFSIQNYFEGTPIASYVFENILYAMIPTLLATIIWFMIRYIRANQLNQIYLVENQMAELKFLKSQLNPHSIFNTLNNIYSLVNKKSPMALLAIEKLANLIRFTTYESPKEFIPLKLELNYIDDLITLEKLRYDERFYFERNLSIADSEILIPPFIIIPLIENVFKHGVLNDKNNPVRVEISSNSDELSVIVRNKIRLGNKDKVGGVGLNNLNKRLAINYKGKLELKSTAEDGFFCVKLNVYGPKS